MESFWTLGVIASYEFFMSVTVTVSLPRRDFMQSGKSFTNVFEKSIVFIFSLDFLYQKVTKISVKPRIKILSSYEM